MKGLEEYKAMAVKPLLRKGSQSWEESKTRTLDSEEKAFTGNCVNVLKNDFEIKFNTPTPECDHVKAALYAYSALDAYASKQLDKKSLSDYGSYMIFSVREKRMKNKQKQNLTAALQEEAFGVF